MDQKQWRLHRNRWKSRLEQWHSPQDFHNACGAFRAEFGRQLLSKAGLSSLYRDAYTASVFACRCDAEKVRLVAADRPDFEVELLGLKLSYEVIEADTPGRRRGDELELVTGDPVPDDFYLTVALARQILETAARRKDRDIYSPDCGLVIFLNVTQPGGDEQQEIEEVMASATEVVAKRFVEVWVLWEGAAYNVWRHGTQSNTILRPPDARQDVEDVTPEPLIGFVEGDEG